MYTVWHVDGYKITFKLAINHWTNEILQHIVVSSGQHLGLSFLTHSRKFFSSEYFRCKTFIHENDKFQENLSRPGIIDAMARFRAAARRLRNSAIDCTCADSQVCGLSVHDCQSQTTNDEGGKWRDLAPSVRTECQQKSRTVYMNKPLLVRYVLSVLRIKEFHVLFVAHWSKAKQSRYRPGVAQRVPGS